MPFPLFDEGEGAESGGVAPTAVMSVAEKTETVDEEVLVACSEADGEMERKEKVEEEITKAFEEKLVLSPTLSEDGEFYAPRAPWHLLATMRLDGRKEFEIQHIIVLDEQHALFNQPNGELNIQHRTIMGPDGQLHQYRWVFREVGIEKMLDRLDLSGESASDETESSNDGDAQEKSVKKNRRGGQTEITLQRVTIDDECEVWNHPPAEHGENKEVDIGHGDSSVQHAAVYDDAGEHVGEHDTIAFELFDRKERPFAVFRFFYRDEKHLRKLGLIEALSCETGSENAEEPALTLSSSPCSEKSRGKRRVRDNFEEEEAKKSRLS